MKTIIKGLCWAAAIILTAIGNALGLIEDATARTLFIVLPILAIIALGSAARCTSLQGRG